MGVGSCDKPMELTCSLAEIVLKYNQITSLDDLIERDGIIRH